MNDCDRNRHMALMECKGFLKTVKYASVGY